MPGVWLSQVVRRLRRDPPADGCSDADLLARFARDRDEAAFELLVWRHGGMVLSACRRSLGHQQDAEDAFQATFLVLARKAGGVGRGAALPAWLHRVAVRISARAARRRRGAAPLVGEVAAPAAADPVAGAEVAALLDAEIDRLPDRLRRAVVLCYLEGLTAAEAGVRLGCPTGTVESRLAAARRTLRARLARRGVTTPVGVFAFVGGEAVLAPEAVAALARAGRAFVTGGPLAEVGDTPVRLAKGELAMGVKRLAAGVGAVGLAVTVSAGIGWADKPTPPVTKTADPPPKVAEVKPADPAKPEAWPLARQVSNQGGRLIAVAADGRSLIFLTGEAPNGVTGRAVSVVDLTGKRLTARVEPPNPVGDATVSPDGKLLATAEGVNGVKLRELPSGKLVEALWPTGGLSVWRVAFTPDGTRLVALGARYDISDRRVGFQGLGQPGGSAGMLTGQAGDPRGMLGGQAESLFGLLGGHLPAATTLHYQLSVWDPVRFKEVGHPAVTVTGPGRTGHRIALAGGKYALLTEPLFKPAVPGGGGPAGPAVDTPNGTKVTILDTVTGAGDRRFVVREGLVPATGVGVDGAVSPDGRSVLAVDVATPAELVVLDTATGKERLRLAGLRRPLKAAAYSADGRWIAAATGGARPTPKGGWGGGGPGSGRPSAPLDDEVSGPSAVVIWDAATGREAARMTDKETIRSYTALRFAPDGSFLATQDSNGSVVIWGRAPEPVTPDPDPTAKPPARAGVPDRFASLLAGLSADGVTDARRVEAVFLAALGRLPTDTEAKALAAQLGRQPDKPAAVRDLLDTLVGTAEFKAHAAALGKLAK